MALPYENATSGDRALAELQRILAKFGCQSFGTMIDADRGVTIVQFRWRNRTVLLEASWKGYAAMWLRANPWKARMRGAQRDHEQRAIKQGRVSVCSVLRDYVKAQVTAVECGMMDFETAFMPHMLLSSGERVIDRVRTTKLLPGKDESDNVGEMKRP